MSVDLTLIFDNPGRRFPGAPALCGADQLVVLHGDGLIPTIRRALDDAIATGNAITPPPVDVYDEDTGLRTTTTDAWGCPLWALPASTLAAISSADLATYPDFHQWNQAVLAFLRMLAPDTPVVLYWS